MNINVFKPALKTMAGLSLSVALLIFFAVPTRSFRALTKEAVTPFFSFVPFATFAALLSAFIFLLWYRAVSERQDGVPNQPVARGQSAKWILAVQLLLSLCIFTRSAIHVDAALDWDESEHISYLAGTNAEAWKVITPFYGQENHPLASLLSFTSMKIFGVSKTAARIPALLMAVLFLIAFNFLAVRFLSPLTSIVCLVFFFADNQVVYMMHSMRGYIDIMFYSLVALIIALDFIESPSAPTHATRKLVIFGAVLTAALITHVFGGIFGGLLFLSLVVWHYVNRKRITASKLAYGNRLLLTCVGALCLFAVTSAFIALHLRETGFVLNKSAVEGWEKTDFFYHLISLFGLVRAWEFRLFVVFLGALLTIRWLFRTETSIFFPSLFLLITTSALFLVAQLLEIRMLESRMLLPFLTLFMVWVGDSLSLIPNAKLRTVGVLFALGLFCLPFTLHRDDDDGVPAHFAADEAFAKQVKSRIAMDKGRCFSFSGDPSGVLYAKNFYFHYEQRRESHSGCAPHYHLYYREGLFKVTFPRSMPKNTESILLYADGLGRELHVLVEVTESQFALQSR